jgi:hypothetical protein
MIYKGIAKGKTIELEDPLPYPKGQPIHVSVEPLMEQPQPGSSAAIRKTMHEPPHFKEEEVDELDLAIREGKLNVHHETIFDS